MSGSDRDCLNGQRDGATFEAKRDLRRLNRQAQTVFDLMQDGRWRTLREISEQTGEPEASISARLRDFRKDRFGGFIVDREHLEAGIWQYRVLQPESKQEIQLELLGAECFF